MNNSEDMELMLQDYALDNRLDRNVLNKVIIRELGTMRPFSTDTKIFKFMLDNFFDKWNYNIGKLIDTMYYEYDPIGNKKLNRTLNENDSKELGETEHRESTADIDNTDTYTTNTDQDVTENNTSENTVSAYDSSTYQPKEKTVTNNTSRTDNDVEHSGETTSDISSDVDTKHDLNESNEHHLGENITGKDGDESYQSLIEQERELAQFNIYDWILKQMRKELFLLVY